MMKSNLTVERLKEVLDYNPETGVFIWKQATSRRIRVGTEAGVIAPNGRRYISIDSKLMMAHRLAWFYIHGEWPVGNVAQKDGDYLNTRADNLRLETAADTIVRGVIRSTNTSGHKGVSFDKSRNRFVAYITRNGKMRIIGRYLTAEAAAEARKIAEVEFEVTDEADVYIRLGKIKKRAYDRRLWLQTLKAAGGVTGWESMEQFIADVGEPQKRHVIFPINPDVMVGPDNFRWSLRGGFDHATPEGRSAYNKNHRSENPNLYRAKSLEKNFGITLEEYQKMFVEQNGVCAICSKPETSALAGKTKWLAVDHNHTTGAIRGLLCGACNTGIGKLCDSVEVLTSAIAYLKKHSVADESVPNNIIPLKKASPDD